VLITAEELRAEKPFVLLDVRWALGDPDGRKHYRDGHIPGAVFVDLDVDLAAPATPQGGRHPLPALEDLQSAARRWGIGDLDTPVVVYDAMGGMAAARAWWLLRWAGLRDVRILDGGLPAWTAAGGALETGESTPPAGAVTLTGGGMPTVQADEVADWSGVLLDARAAERYRGELEPVDPRAGHIPGALNAPTSENLYAAGRFVSPEVLRERFAALGVGEGRPVAVYCGSGVTAAHEIAALAVAGIDAALYPGSWSQWSAAESRPAETAADVELVAIYTPGGRVAGTATRHRMRAEKLWHGATMIALRSTDGERIYVHRRSLDKDIFPGSLDCFAGGVISSGEDPDAGARRELAEELGVSGVELHPLLNGNRHQDVATHAMSGWSREPAYRLDDVRCHFWVYEAFSDGPLTLQPEEVVSGEWLTLPALAALLADPAADIVPDGRAIAVEWLSRR
jgi:thiosulfate/3-mercaptopyruvate sulfurtransferase